mmetsp:Transcript_55236/g.109697  ORF Transcript_55236/g.109697 Transcript_55236/m.109697 type:complete len:241 (+) Transcript_55236:216-938(+)|eukprot:CAMPEP_0174756330 /NCGR_PEP_ID=MMETSP1094-20130205/106702_1 /TAXON_ID=156173 /ORGANISM="Chrysochromulina brevifilum, Strain UTEX LB 985" /LENGTH=240 /DNA_ID=CAMNT_0015962237 /DNA_START=214 /DNA_END=936 /DNA_ORIENTATION=+
MAKDRGGAYAASQHPQHLSLPGCSANEAKSTLEFWMMSAAVTSRVPVGSAARPSSISLAPCTTRWAASLDQVQPLSWLIPCTPAQMALGAAPGRSASLHSPPAGIEYQAALSRDELSDDVSAELSDVDIDIDMAEGSDAADLNADALAIASSSLQRSTSSLAILASMNCERNPPLRTSIVRLGAIVSRLGKLIESLPMYRAAAAEAEVLHLHAYGSVVMHPDNSSRPMQRSIRLKHGPHT